MIVKPPSTVVDEIHSVLAMDMIDKINNPEHRRFDLMHRFSYKPILIHLEILILMASGWCRL